MAQSMTEHYLQNNQQYAGGKVLHKAAWSATMRSAA